MSLNQNRRDVPQQKPKKYKERTECDLGSTREWKENSLPTFSALYKKRHAHFLDWAFFSKHNILNLIKIISQIHELRNKHCQKLQDSRTRLLATLALELVDRFKSN